MRRVLVAFCLVAAAAGCAAPRGGFAPSRDVCVSALPTAFDAVHEQGSLVSVHRLREPVTRLFPPPATAPEGVICIFIFKGPYAPGSVTGTTAGGRYALLAVTTTHPRVVQVRMLSRLRSRL